METNVETAVEEDCSETVKPLTAVYFILGLVVPLWIVTLPLFWFLAYKSYKSPNGKPLFENTGTTASQKVDNAKAEQISGESKLTQLEKLNDLKEKGILSEEEFNAEKGKILASS